MRDLIARALTWVLHLLPSRRPAGRHTARYLTAHPTTPKTAPEFSVWSRPWTGSSAREAREIFHAEEAATLGAERRERYFATAWAERGYDYPYIAGGVHQVRGAAA
ncbi:hypothetical protein [Streptomyces sp. NPDC001889]